MKYPYPILGIVAALLVQAGIASGRPLVPEPHYAEICSRLARRLPEEHLLRMPLDDTISSRAWTNFLATLDHDRAYFLKADIDRFSNQQLIMDDAIKRGDMRFAFDAFATLQQRMSNRVDYVERVLAEGFDLSLQETYHWQREDAPWLENEEEWDQLWRKRIKNEYLRLIINRERTEATMQEDEPTTTTNAVDVLAPETPEESILDRYRQVFTFFDNSDPEWLLQEYLTSFMQAYDPHSGYLPPSALKNFEIEMNLSLVGIGALLRSREGAAEIVSLIPGGPADQDIRDIRLKPGDRIIAVAQDEEEATKTLHWPLQRVVKLIRGEIGTRVVLTVIPASDRTGATRKTVDLIRDEVKLEEQAASSKVRTVTGRDGSEHTLGVIRLPAFYGSMLSESPNDSGYRSCVLDVRNLLWEMQKEPLDGMILDLRGNGGGSLKEAVAMTGLFIRRGASARVKSYFGVRTLSDRDPSVAYGGPLVVLVNRLSASAAEIVAGALQDHGRAVLVGDSKTHGKGTVQGLLFMDDDPERLGALKVTNAIWYRISGAPTQLRGVTPDIIVPSPWDYLEMGERFLRNPIPWSNVRPAAYTPVADLDGVIAEIAAASELRRREDKSFQAYIGLLERIGKMNRSGELPLNIDARRDMAAIEEELSDLQDRLAMAHEEGSEDATEAVDLVLKEGLQILSDLVDLRRTATDIAGPLDRETTSGRPSIAEWLRNNL